MTCALVIQSGILLRLFLGDSSEVSGPFPCWNRPTQELLQRIVIDRNQRDYLKEEDVDFMRGALNTYIKFLEKQREKRANKLKEFQEGLPIAKERDNLVRILKDNQVVQNGVDFRLYNECFLSYFILLIRFCCLSR